MNKSSKRFCTFEEFKNKKVLTKFQISDSCKIYPFKNCVG